MEGLRRLQGNLSRHGYIPSKEILEGLLAAVGVWFLAELVWAAGSEGGA